MFLGKAIDEETGNQLVATMLYLDSENKKDLNLYINCSGGDVSNYSMNVSTVCPHSFICSTALHACTARMLTDLCVAGCPLPGPP